MFNQQAVYERGIKTVKILLKCGGLTMWSLHFNDEVGKKKEKKRSLPTVQWTMIKRHILTVQRTDIRRPFKEQGWKTRKIQGFLCDHRVSKRHWHIENPKETLFLYTTKCPKDTHTENPKQLLLFSVEER